MKKKVLVLFLLFFSLILLAQNRQTPNIVMIAIDDLNDWVGALGGNPQVKTPNMDKLAQKSMVFRNASCPGPVCGPSRSALLSGFMPAKTGIYSNSTNMLNSEIVQTHATLPEYFSKNGYLTISSGKIFHVHATSNGMDHGQWAYDIWKNTEGNDGGIQEDKMFSCYRGIINGKKIENPLYQSDEPANDLLFGPCKAKKETIKDYRTAKWFEQKLQENHDKPFFMSVGFSKPHLPFIVPEDFFNMYNTDTLKLPETRADDLNDILNSKGDQAYQPKNDYLWAKHYGIEKEVIRAYMASISYADACVGVVLDALAKSKYAENTIVVLWGDHGWHLGEKQRYGKATLWRESTQLPFMIHLPGMRDRQDCFRNVNLIDIYPTLIDLCNLPRKVLDGKSIKPLLGNPNKEWTPAVTTLNQGNHSVMSEKWHYIFYKKNGIEELYNLENDPMEWTNLAGRTTEEISKVKKNLKSYLPTYNAESILIDKKGNQLTNKRDSGKKTDLTIKAKRDLILLK